MKDEYRDLGGVDSGWGCVGHRPVGEEARERWKTLPVRWRLCRTCLGICNGLHEAVVAQGELFEQRCGWKNDSGQRCVLAAPHGYTPHRDSEGRKWNFGTDEQGRKEKIQRGRPRKHSARKSSSPLRS